MPKGMAAGKPQEIDHGMHIRSGIEREITTKNNIDKRIEFVYKIQLCCGPRPPGSTDY
jgi:hypothetical protein